jgi:hypothetical protein
MEFSGGPVWALVAGNLEDAALMLGGQWAEYIASSGLDHGERAGLVGFHQPAKAGYIGGGGEPTIGAFFSHPDGCFQSVRRLKL